MAKKETKKKGKGIFVIGILIVIIIIVVLVFISKSGNSYNSSDVDTFAKCITQKGAIMYGTFWCPHCANQKGLFGRSAKKLPYIECSTPDSNGQLQVCKDKGITTYPTWDFADGERKTGEIPLDYLSQKTGCELPVPAQ